MSLRFLMFLTAFGCLVIGTNIEAVSAEKTVAITVYRSPSCGCCKKWLNHLEHNGFKINDIVTDDMQAIKNKYGVPKEMASCHTALVDGYVVEGHVPASDIIDLLKNKPAVIGISVPGMVTGSPGMEMGARVDPYDVVSFDKNRNFKVVKSYRSDK